MTKVILFYGPSLTFGGMAKVFLALARLLEDNGYVVKVLLPFQDDGETIAIPKRYVVATLPRSNRNNERWGRFWHWFDIVTCWYFYFKDMPKIDCDVFVSYQGATTSHWSRYLNRPSVCWFHSVPGNRIKRNPLISILSDFCIARNYNKYDKLVTVSSMVGEMWCKRFPINKKMLEIVNLVDVNDILQKANEFDPKFDHGYKNIVCVSRLSKEKGVIRLLQSTKKIIAEGESGFRVYIIGDGPEEEMLISYVKDNGLSSCVILLGRKDNPYPYIKRSSLLISPSYGEGFGLTLWEALILGVPVVSTNCGGPVDALAGGRWGRLVENSDDGICAGIRDFLRGVSYVPDIGFDEVRQQIMGRISTAKEKILMLFDDLANT